MTNKEKIEQFIDENEDAVYSYISINLCNYIAPEDMPLDDNWEDGVNDAIEYIINDYTFEQFTEEIIKNI